MTLQTLFPGAGPEPGGSNTADFTVDDTALSWASSAQAQPPRAATSRGRATLCPAPVTDPCVQVLSVTEQLDAGVRYLDLRIAHMEEGSERNLHFVHMVYTTALVEVGARAGAASQGQPRAAQAGQADLCAWVRAQCPGSAAGCTNIIAGDFIGASGFVSDVIGLNRKLLRG